MRIHIVKYTCFILIYIDIFSERGGAMLPNILKVGRDDQDLWVYLLQFYMKSKTVMFYASPAFIEHTTKHMTRHTITRITYKYTFIAYYNTRKHTYIDSRRKSQ